MTVPSTRGSMRSTAAPRVPKGAARQVMHYLGEAVAAERQLHDTLTFLAERHERNFEVANGLTTLAIWTTEDLAAAEPLIERYGAEASERAAHLRSALFRETRVGAVAELADLGDASLLVQHAAMAWTTLRQGGRELHDTELVEVAAACLEHHRRQLAWIRTQLEHEAPDAISIPLDPVGQAAASLPAHPDAMSSIPPALWGPLVAGLSLLVVGALGALVDRPWLMPSLGPTAVLLALTPADPSARAYPTIAGHGVGLLAGALAVVVTGAAAAPAVLADGQLVPERVAAAVIAVMLTVAAGAALRAGHPPAAATTLLVALGAIKTIDQAAALMIGVVILAAVGWVFRSVRLERPVPAERRAPSTSLVGLRLGRH
jgi:hypothetical protein